MSTTKFHSEIKVLIITILAFSYFFHIPATMIQVNVAQSENGEIQYYKMSESFSNDSSTLLSTVESSNQSLNETIPFTWNSNETGRNYVGGDSIKIYRNENFTKKKILLFSHKFSEIEKALNHSSEYAIYQVSTYNQFIGELPKCSAAIISKFNTPIMAQEEQVVMLKNLLRWVRKGNLLIIDDPKIIAIQLQQSLGISEIIHPNSSLKTELYTVGFQPKTALVYNLPYTKLEINETPTEFLLENNSKVQSAATLYRNSRCLNKTIAILGSIGDGFCLACGFDLELAFKLQKYNVLRAIFSNAFNIYASVHLSVSTDSFYFNNSISPHVYPLQADNQILQNIQAIASKLSKMGFNVFHNNLLYADYKGGYYASLSLHGSLDSFVRTFSSNISINYNRSLQVKICKPISIPEFATTYINRIIPTIFPKLLWSQGWSPPQVSYYHLAPNNDAVVDMGADDWIPESVEKVLEADDARSEFNVDGDGVNVVVIDSGFSHNSFPNELYPTSSGFHPFYDNYYYDLVTQRYSSHSTTGYDPDDDHEYGHGTAIVSNLLAIAPGIDLDFINYWDPVEAFTIVLSNIEPDVVSCSWGYDASHPENFPDGLLALIRQCAENGMIVLFGSGNYDLNLDDGQIVWPSYEDCVVAVGGSYVSEDGSLRASTYASSYERSDRIVPDVCGIVGKKCSWHYGVHGILIEMPTEPGSSLDVDYATGHETYNDETEPDDGWLVASGTSSATPQVAGLAALVKQIEPDINVGEFKHILFTTSTDIIDGYSANNDEAQVGFDKATGAGLINVYRALETIIMYSSSDKYKKQTIPEGKLANFYGISTPYGPGYHIDTIGTGQYSYNFFGYLASRDGSKMTRRTGMGIIGYFRQYDTFSPSMQEGRRYLNLYILSADGKQILKTVNLLDHNDGTSWKFVEKTFEFDWDENYGMVRFGIGRRDSWSDEFSLTAEWASVQISSYDTWYPDTTPEGKPYHFWDSIGGQDMGTLYHIDTAGFAAVYSYNFYAYSDYQPYLGWYYDIHITGWFRQYDTFSETKQPGRRYVDFYIIDPNTLQIIVSKRILEYYDGTDWVYRRIHYKCGFFSGNYLLAIGRRDSWSHDFKLTAEWCNVQIWTYG
jgi:hypothetical protein